MRYEVIESAGEWIVLTDGVEQARFAVQADALSHVAARLRGVRSDEEAISLRVSFARTDPQTRISK